jgi:hypothetical protein
VNNIQTNVERISKFSREENMRLNLKKTKEMVIDLRIMKSEIAMITIDNIPNKLSMNISETKFIVFKSSKKKQNYDTTILLNNENIEQAKTTTFLGVVIDEHLTWSHHSDMIHKKMMKSTAIISKSRHYIKMNARKLLYYALVYPYLIYCNLIWGNTYKTIIQRLVSIQLKEENETNNI